MCPFSGTVCRNCALYRGRHYLLCYSRQYRGCLPGASKNPPMVRNYTDSPVIMPSLPSIKKEQIIN